MKVLVAIAFILAGFFSSDFERVSTYSFCNSDTCIEEVGTKITTDADSDQNPPDQHGCGDNQHCSHCHSSVVEYNNVVIFRPMANLLRKIESPLPLREVFLNGIMRPPIHLRMKHS